MSIEELKAHLSVLQDDRQKMQDQLMANLNAFNGAIQECQYWIDQINVSAVTPATPEKLPAEVPVESNVSFPEVPVEVVSEVVSEVVAPVIPDENPDAVADVAHAE